MEVSHLETVAQVAPRIGDLIDRATRRAIADVPGYAEFREIDVSDGIQRDLQLCIAALVEDRDFSDEDRETMSIIGQTRAQQGLPLEAMLQVYWISVDEVFSELWRAAEDGDVTPDAAFGLARSAWQLVGPMIEIAVRAYHREQLALAVADSQRLTSLVHGLLHTPTDGDATDIAALGLDPRGDYLAFRATRTDGDTRRLMLDLKLPGALDHGYFAPHEGGVIGLAAARPNIFDATGTIVAVGPAGRIHELPRSFAVASRIMDTAFAFRREGVFGVDDLALESLARADSALGDALVDRYVQPVGPNTAAGREILTTIRTLLEHDLSAERAASELFVHANTVRNRQKRFEELTRCSLRSLTTCTEVRLALLRASVD